MNKKETKPEPSASLMEAWLDSQKILWEGWVNLVSAKPASAASALPNNAVELWNRIIQQSMQAWTTGAAPIAKSTAEQFLSVQETSLRFMDFTARAWEVLAPKMAAGEHWETDLKDLIDQFRQGWIQFPGLAAATTQDVNQLWDIYLKQWQFFGQPWDAALRQTPEFFARALSGDSSAYVGLSQLYREAYQGTFARLVASPGLGLTREFNEKIQQGFAAWVSWQLASLEYQGVLSGIWDQAFEKFFQDLLAMAEKDEKLETIRDLVLLWTRGAEDVFSENFRTEAYVLAQGKMLNAAMEYRIRERAIIEVFLNLYDLPTRSELDETHRRVYALRQEVKALRRETEALKKTLAAVQSVEPGGEA